MSHAIHKSVQLKNKLSPSHYALQKGKEAFKQPKAPATPEAPDVPLTPTYSDAQRNRNEIDRLRSRRGKQANMRVQGSDNAGLSVAVNRLLGGGF